MAQGGLRPSVTPAHERESRRGGGDRFPSARERRSIVCPSGERSEEESQALLGCLRFTSKVGCPARCRGGSRTAPTRSHRQFRPRIGVRGRRRAGIQGRGVGTGGGLGFFTAFRMTGTRDHSCGLRNPEAFHWHSDLLWIPVCTGMTDDTRPLSLHIQSRLPSAM